MKAGQWLILPLVLAVLAACTPELPGSETEYVGAAVCASCHADEYDAWRGSHHDLAMQSAAPASVLGDFEDARFDYAGISSTFFQRDGSYRVVTDGPDGELAEFEIHYTFGVEPLQQYLIELPGGRLQALGIAWDSRPPAQGGQRWFHLYPDESVDADHSLHWTGRNQNWNYMCAECHSTGLEKRYDPATDSYDTQWSEINVACEACHGPGAAHVEWARSKQPSGVDFGLTVVFHERHGVHWLPDAEIGTARRSVPRHGRIEIDSCGRCHGRASRLLGDQVHGGSLLDSHRPVLLEPDQYHVDGQMLAELFNWGPFLQSRMAQAGVTCSDCHQPHSLSLRAPGNALCAQCHQPDHFDKPGHTHHLPDSAGSQCTACHMPQVTFMQIDQRHDHAFRIPRPDLSVELGVPNACTDCHQDRSADWAADALTNWYPKGPDRSRDFAHALQAAVEGAPGVRDQLHAVISNDEQPAIVRASALRALAPWLDADTLVAVIGSLDDPDPLVRMAAVGAMADTDPGLQAEVLARLLADPVLAVRIEAVAILAGSAEALLDARQRDDFGAALADYLETLHFDADRPEANVRLANLHARRGEAEAAEASLRRALWLDEKNVEAHVNLADLERARGSEPAAEAVLRSALDKVPEAAELHHVLGLSLVRQRRQSAAMQALADAVELAPTNPHYRYVLAVALHDWGQADQARSQLEQNLARHPYHLPSLSALTIYLAQAGQQAEARALLARLEQLEPGNPAVRQLAEWIGNSENSE